MSPSSTALRIHHLNCGTMRPFGGRLINGDRLPFLPARLVCHCLLIETDRGLVLVDTGFGLDDIAEARRGGAGAGKLERARHRYTRFFTRPSFDPDETAVRQVTSLGHSPDDVEHIVLTHLDLDHAGGLRDFPAAKVHVNDAEYRAAMSPATTIERFRYWAHQWSHGPDWVTYGSIDGDRWFGFEAVRELRGLPGIALVPLPGHTRGHAGVAVRVGGAEADARWLLHAGDAYFFYGEVDPVSPRSTPGLKRFQARFQIDGSARHRNRERLRELAGAQRGEIELFCTHDPVEFERYAAPALASH